MTGLAAELGITVAELSSAIGSQYRGDVVALGTPAGSLSATT
jgi:hypothetical protein